MKDIVRWEPFGDVAAIRGEMERMLSRFFGDGEDRPPGRFAPAADVEETDGEIVITLELPGIAQEDVDVTFEDGRLTIAGERRHDREVKDEHYRRYERGYGRFSRMFRLPEGTAEDAIVAEMTDGLLRVTVAKPEERAAARIPIAAGTAAD